MIINRIAPVKGLADDLFVELKKLSLKQQMTFFEHVELHTEKLSLLKRRLTDEQFESDTKITQDSIFKNYFTLAPISGSTVNFQAFLLSQIQLSFHSVYPEKRVKIKPKSAEEHRTKWIEKMKKCQQKEDADSPIPDSGIFLDLIFWSLE